MPSPRKSAPSIPKHEQYIVGGVIGGIALLFLILGTFVYFYLRQRKVNSRQLEELRQAEG